MSSQRISGANLIMGKFLCVGSLFLVISFFLSSCAPTPDEIRANNMWRNFGEDVLPPIPPPPINFVSETKPISGSPGDVTFWQHPTKPRRTIFIGIDEAKKSTGLYVYDLNGKQIQKITGLQGPKDVEVEYGFMTKDKVRTDIVAVLERNTRSVRFYVINKETRKLSDVTGNTRVFKDLIGPEGSPMSLAMYRDKSERTFVFLSRKVNDGDGIIWQYELKSNQGKIDLVFTREFGKFSGRGMVDNLLVDDGNGFLYYSDPESGVRKYNADAEKGGLEISRLGGLNGSGFQGKLSALGLYITPGKRGEGFLIMIDRRQEKSAAKLFKREGEFDNPNNQLAIVDEIVFEADNPGGFDVISMPVMKEYPEGVIVMANAARRNYRVFSWKRARIQREQHVRELVRQRKADL